MSSAPSQVELHAVEEVEIGSLAAGGSPRLAGEDPAHVETLAGTQAELPPIIVHRQTMRVIDGMHRVRAAVLLGRRKIAVRFFDGPEEDAFVLGVKSNIAHGLPLSLADRKHAAERVISSHPRWSDRMIAAVTGISAKTVAEIRRNAGGDAEGLPGRIGRDGRVRPADVIEGRWLARELITKDPGLSLRQVARAAGISPETVRDVKKRLLRGEDPLPRGRPDVLPQRRPAESPQPRPAGITGLNPAGRNPAGRGRAGGSHAGGGPADRDAAGRNIGVRPRRAGLAGSPAAGTRAGSAPPPAVAVERLRADPALRFNENGRDLIRLLNLHVVRTEDWSGIIDSVPAHCRETVAQLARDCARKWLELASLIERNMAQP
ncbi:hypothetical protein GCM10010191_87350 [Actinomadura vinacea]|uniref:ParB-like N-terminal domain-containing protein n=1 Tax=Actinomadura vinacea TaxID=115336 RepID=A0ABN3KBB6_9ACTN